MDHTFINVPTQSTRRERELARSEACSHVSRFAHRRRGRGRLSLSSDERPVRSLASPPFTSAVESRPFPARSLSSSTSSSLPAPIKSSKSPTTSISESESPAPQQPRSDRAGANPWHLINSGNSDPFASMPIPITPAVNRVIAFFCSHLQYLFPDRSGPPDSPRVVFRMTSQGLIYDTHVDSLREECSSRSFIFYASALRAQWTQSEEAYRELSMAQTESQRLLHTRIQSAERSDDTVLYSVVAHFAASVILKDYRRATHHGRFLRNLLLLRVNNDVSIPLGLLELAAWYDAHLAIAQLQPSLLGGEHWIPQLLRPIEQSVAICLDELPTGLTTLFDPIVSSQPLHGAISRLRQSSALGVRPSQNFLNQTVSCVLFADLNLCVSRLRILNCYMDAQTRLHDSTTPLDGSQRLHLYVEAMVSIAIIYHLDLRSIYTCCFAKYVQKGDILINTLQLSIASTLQCAAELGAEAKDYHSACLFALFVELQGRIWMARTNGIPLRGGHDLEFTTLARNMDLRTWTDVKDVCDGFFLSSVVEPKGEDWVDDLLSRDVEQPGGLQDFA